MEKSTLKNVLEETLQKRVNSTTLMQYLDLVIRLENGEKISDTLLGFDDSKYSRSKKTIQKELRNLVEANIVVLKEGNYTLKLKD